MFFGMILLPSVSSFRRSDLSFSASATGGGLAGAWPCTLHPGPARALAALREAAVMASVGASVELPALATEGTEDEESQPTGHKGHVDKQQT